MQTLVLLILSNLFMTTAWYWHLQGGPKVAEARPLAMAARGRPRGFFWRSACEALACGRSGRRA